MLSSFVEIGLISPEQDESLRKVYAICSAAIHGEEISEAKINFVRDVAPEIIASLQAAKIYRLIEKE